MKNKERTCVIGGFFLINKRVIVLLSLVLFLASAVCYAAIFAPEWTEFCPPRYCESNENAFSKDATYWYKRRMQFEKSLAKCSAFRGEELDNCYAEIRAAEERKNKVWDVRQEEKYRTTEYNRQYNKERMEFYGINQILETIKK